MKPRNRAMNLEIKQVIEKLGLTSDKITEFYDEMMEKYREKEQKSDKSCDPDTHKED
jgi:chorismate mutase